MRWLAPLLIFIPISIGAHLTHKSEVFVFIFACLAIVPLAGYIGNATEELAKYLGASTGGLLNATFGNATELIVTIQAIRAGELDLVRASIAGSIIGNTLLVLGLSLFIGGLKFKKQTFNKEVAGNHTVMLILAVAAICIPSLFIHSVPGGHDNGANAAVQSLSIWVSVVLILLYVGSLVYALKTHVDIFRDGEDEEREEPCWSKGFACMVLAASTAVIAYESEILVRAVTPTVDALHINKLFVGVILIPIIGNAAEHSTAVMMAVKNKLDVSLNICVSSSAQIALFVAPLVVLLSIPLGHAMAFNFNNFELIAISFSSIIAAFIARDGQSDWFEGAQLLTVYMLLALAFYFIPH